MASQIINPGPVAEGFGSPNMMITQGYQSGASPPPPPQPLAVGGVIVTYIPLNDK